MGRSGEETQEDGKAEKEGTKKSIAAWECRLADRATTDAD